MKRSFAALLATITTATMPMSVAAQCPPALNTDMLCANGPGFIQCVKKWAQATGPVNCVSPSSTNVFNCHFASTGTRSLVASATTAVTGLPRSCQFMCDCGPITLTNSDGLPVELLDFEIDASQTGEEAEVDESRSPTVEARFRRTRS